MSEPAAPATTPRTSRLRELAGALVIVLVLAGVALTVGRNRHAFADSIKQVGILGFLLSLLFGLVGVGATHLEWRAVLAGLGIRFAPVEGAQVFFVSQLGKYLPGSVWPVLMQMEAARRRGADRKTLIATNMITVVLSIAVGVVLAGILLPFSYAAALHRFWWALAALPLVLVLAHPRSLPYLLNRVLVLLRRKPLDVQMSVAATARASAWAGLGWLGLGLHLTVLCALIGHFSTGLVALCIGGMALAVSAGVLFIPAPAGAGMREVVLGYVLVSVLDHGQVVAVVVASRVILIVADLVLAAGATLAARIRGLPQLAVPAG